MCYLRITPLRHHIPNPQSQGWRFFLHRYNYMPRHVSCVGRVLALKLLDVYRHARNLSFHGLVWRAKNCSGDYVVWYRRHHWLAFCYGTDYAIYSGRAHPRQPH